MGREQSSRVSRATLNTLILRSGNGPGRGDVEHCITVNDLQIHLSGEDTAVAGDVAQELDNQSKLFGNH